MRTKASSRSNMRFLKGNVLFFALILLVMVLFMHYTLQNVKPVAAEEAVCRVVLDKSCSGNEMVVCIGDSVLFAGVPQCADTLEIARYDAADKAKSYYTSLSVLRVVCGGDTVAALLQGDRFFKVGVGEAGLSIVAIQE